MIIKIPQNNINERKYILDILFDEFLGLEFELNLTNSIDEWQICLNNGKNLIIKDSFFNKFNGDLEYLKFENIPTNVNFAKNQFISELDIPILYGDDLIKVSDDEIVCGIDIFASSFIYILRTLS